MNKQRGKKKRGRISPNARKSKYVAYLRLFSYEIKSALYLLFLPLLLNIEMENLNEFPRNSVFSI